MSSRKKPSPVQDDQLKDERIRHVNNKINQVGDGKIFLYTWNIDKYEKSPLGLYVNPEHVEIACRSLVDMGGKRSVLKDGHGDQIDMSDISGIQGSVMNVYKSGKITVMRGSDKGVASPDSDFYKTVLIDACDLIAKSIKAEEGQQSAQECADEGLKQDDAAHVDENRSKESNSEDGRYKIIPVVLKNSIPAEVKKNPKALQAIVAKLKPDVQLEDIRVNRDGDVEVVGKTPRDYSILRQNNWPDHETYGKIIPTLPKEKTVDQAVLILGLHTDVSESDIEEQLIAVYECFPKAVARFNKPQSSEKSTTVKVTLGSLEQKNKLLQNRFKIFSQSFKVVNFESDPEIIQCFKCQKYGHYFRECKEQQKCLRCGEEGHRLVECKNERHDVTCANCQGKHAANYRGCPEYKKAVAQAKAVIQNESGSAGNIFVPSANKVNECTADVGQQLPNCVQEGIIDQVSDAILNCLQGFFNVIKDCIVSKKAIDLRQCKLIAQESAHVICETFQKSTAGNKQSWSNVVSEGRNGVGRQASRGGSGASSLAGSGGRFGGGSSGGSGSGGRSNYGGGGGAEGASCNIGGGGGVAGSGNSGSNVGGSCQGKGKGGGSGNIGGGEDNGSGSRSSGVGESNGGRGEGGGRCNIGGGGDVGGVRSSGGGFGVGEGSEGGGNSHGFNRCGDGGTNGSGDSNKGGGNCGVVKEGGRGVCGGCKGGGGGDVCCGFQEGRSDQGNFNLDNCNIQ